MATLSGNKVKDTYTSLLKLESNGVTSTLKTVEDGAGVDSALKISTDKIEVDALKFETTPTASASELTALLVDANGDVVSRDLHSSAFSAPTTTLADLTDTNITSVGANHWLYYNNSTSKWTNTSVQPAQQIKNSASSASVTTDSSGRFLFTAGSGINIGYSGSTVTFSATPSGFANPTYVLRPSGSYSLTTTSSKVPQATIGHGSSTGSYLFNDAGNAHLSTSSVVTGGVTIKSAGVCRIDVNLVAEITTTNTEVTIKIQKQPSGGSATTIQSITRNQPTGNVAIGFSLYHHFDTNDDVYYEVSRNSSGGGSLTTQSTVSIIKMD